MDTAPVTADPDPGKGRRHSTAVAAPAAAEKAAAERAVGGNPYVGPRPFELGERLWGRDEEIAAVYFLLSAERIVLLHSPSGAGKSSLVAAGLIPRLRERFDVWRPTRVNQEPGAAAADGRRVNRYVHSAILGFEEGIPALAEYVAGRPRRPGAPPSAVVIFDQFEEVLTVDPLAVAAKEEFFDQLGELLHDPRMWALFVLREDYLAPLDPYAERVPTHLKNRFRIDLLGLAAAREAIVNPARENGREFPAADRLVHDLATMKIQQPDGSFREQAGIYVEPVQLQVVCRRLWDAMPADDPSIDVEDVERFGNVDTALAQYYASSVARIAGDGLESHRIERLIRDWCGERLITAGGIRNQVLMGAGESEGLANDLIEQLRSAHLVRAEHRAGATWYELAHDRLIAPVLGDNAAWREEYLSPVQRRAALWARQGRPRGLLLAPEELEGNEVETVGDPTNLTGMFIAASAEVRERAESRERQQQLEKELAQARRIHKLAVAVTVFAVLALAVGAAAVWQWRRAEVARSQADEQRGKAEAQQRRAEKQKQVVEQQKALVEILREQAEGGREQAIQESLRANKESRAAKEAKRVADRQKQRADEEALRAQRAQGEAQRAQGEAQRALAWAYSEDAQRLIAAGQRKEALAYLAKALSLGLESAAARGRVFALLLDSVHPIPSGPLRHGGPVSSASFSPDGARLVTASGNLVQVWDAATGLPLGEPLSHEKPVLQASFSPDGQRLATVSGRAVQVWDAATGQPQGKPLGHQRRVVQASFSPDGQRLVTASGNIVQVWDADGRQILKSSEGDAARVWHAETGKPLSEPLRHRGSPSFMAVSPDGTRGVTASKDGMARIRYLGPPAGTILRHEAGVVSVSFGADGRRVITQMDGGAVRVWDAATGQPLREEAAAPAAPPRAYGRWEVRTEDDGDSARVWDMVEGKPVGEPLRHDGRVRSASFSPDGQRVVTASEDGTARVWDTVTGRPVGEPLQHDGWVLSAAFSPDGQRVVTGSADGTAGLWDVLTSTATEAGEMVKAAEILAGYTVTGRGSLERIPSPQQEEGVVELRRKAGEAPERRPTLASFLRWYFTPPAERSRSPLSGLPIE
jgi:WD40 repeat protein